MFFDLIHIDNQGVLDVSRFNTHFLKKGMRHIRCFFDLIHIENLGVLDVFRYNTHKMHALRKCCVYTTGKKRTPQNRLKYAVRVCF